MFKKIKDFINSNLGQNLIFVGVLMFLIFKSVQGKSNTENHETMRFIAFGIIIMLSYTVSFAFISRLYKTKTEISMSAKKPVLSQSRYIIGFIAIIVLALIFNSFMLVLYAIGFGILWGVLYGIFWLLSKQGMKIWDLLKKHKRKQMFDYFSNRPENRRRDSENKDQ